MFSYLRCVHETPSMWSIRPIHFLRAKHNVKSLAVEVETLTAFVGMKYVLLASSRWYAEYWPEMESVQAALALLRRVVAAVQALKDVKTDLHQRYADYSSVLKSLESKPDVIEANHIKTELDRLRELFTRVEGLLDKFTAGSGDGWCTKFHKKTERAAKWPDVKVELDQIDADVMRQLAIMNLKGVLSSSELQILRGVRGVDRKIDHLSSLVKEMCPRDGRVCW